jgi:hypothetical protein
MAVYKGRLFIGTLPSGRVLSMEAGNNVTWDHSFPAGWHHVAAVRENDTMRVYLDGVSIVEKVNSDLLPIAENQNIPMQIGFGAQDHFKGHLSDLRVYRGALPAEDVAELARHKKN